MRASYGPRLARTIAFTLVKYRNYAGQTGRSKVAVAMSGGIDSSAAAFLLKKQGYDCVGVFMSNWDSTDEVGSGDWCTMSQDKKDAREVCDRLDIPMVEVEFMKEYWNEVFLPFLESYQSGIETPNPDVYCNRHIKFDAFLKYAMGTVGADYMATGHYARTSPTHGLLRGLDNDKDQSYFLSLVHKEAFDRVLFPLGEYKKSEVRDLVRGPLRGLAVVKKRESMGVCFIGKRKFRDFLGQYIDLTPGRFVDAESGAILGHHEGAELYTTGQGARIGGTTDKYFVVSRHQPPLQCSTEFGLRYGDLFVVKNTDHPLLLSKSITMQASTLSWVCGSPPHGLLHTGSLRCQCKTRYRQALTSCTLFLRPDSDEVVVTFDQPTRAVTLGQVIVFYAQDVCLGGGVIGAS